MKDIESGFSRRGGGRRLWLQCQSWTPFGGGHDRASRSWGEGERPQSATVQFEDWDKPPKEYTLEEVLQEAGQAAGFTVKVSPSTRAIKRAYWAQQNESSLNFGARLAKELGGNFKVVGDVATMVHATDGVNADGEQIGTIDAEWGVNLIGWRIKPFSAEPQAQKAASVVYDRGKGAFDVLDRAIGGDPPFGLSRAITSLPAPAPNKQTAEQWNVGLSEGSLANRGTGSVILNGEPAAQPDGRVNIKGARAGVDGNYGIDEVEHVYSRSGGFITTLSVKFPQPLANDIIYGKEWGWVKPPGD